MSVLTTTQHNYFIKMLPMMISRQTLRTYSQKSLTARSNLHSRNILLNRSTSRTCFAITKSAPKYQMPDFCLFPKTHLFSNPWKVSAFLQCSKTEHEDNSKNEQTKDDISRTQEDDFTEVLYQQPNMRRLFILNKLKTYQAVFVTGYIPFLSYYYIQGQIGAVTLIGQSFMALSLLGGLYYMSSSFLSHIAGAIHINSSGDQVKIARMTVWKGSRQEDVIDVDDVMPLSVGRERFRQIKLYSDDDFYFVDKKVGRFPNKEKFVEIFGK